jgi:hypothetical protein
MATVLFTRWFQSNVFSPEYRPPGADAQDRPAPAPTQRALSDIIRLRDRFAPYVEGERANIAVIGPEWSNRTPMGSPKDYERCGQRLRGFAFGPRVWVQPVSSDCAETVPVALPPGACWFDFWTGAVFSGDQTVRPSASLEVLPLFVRAGTILPLAIPSARPSETGRELELRIYPGSDASLVVPGGGDFGPLTLEWNEQARELRFKATPASANAPRGSRELQVVLVGPGRGAGPLAPSRPDQVVLWDGSEDRCVRFPAAPARPAAPAGLAAQAKAGRMVFSWLPAGPVAAYRLKRTRAPGPGAVYEEVASGLLMPEHAMPIAALGAGYHYVVTALNTGGESPPSALFALAVRSDSTASLAPNRAYPGAAFPNAFSTPAIRPVVGVSVHSPTRTRQVASFPSRDVTTAAKAV